MHKLVSRLLRTGGILAALIGLPALAPAQGAYVNFEAPSVKPITVARIGNQNYLLVCNAPDNSVEIYRCSNLAFVMRVPVGQYPVTVRWNPALEAFYTCNFIGDSVTRVVLSTTGTTPAVLLTVTNFVGDEPCDLAFLPDQLSALVTLNTKSALSWIDTVAVQPYAGAEGSDIKLTHPLLDTAALKALKDPRRIAWQPGPKLFVMGTRGGNRPAHDYDLLSVDFASKLQVAQGGLGSTNHGLEFTSNGTAFVCGTFARNDLIGESAVSQAPTGFVESHVWLVRNPGTANAIIEDRDVNRLANGTIATPVAAVSQPTDLALYESQGALVKVFFTAFHSDRVGILHAAPGHVSTWLRSTIDLAPPTAEYSLVGPRALVLKPADFTASGDPGPRLYVLNTLSSSFSVIDPNVETEIARVQLQGDPTPRSIRIGRKGLYGAKLSSTGFVACASCHLDGSTDGLAWDLSSGAATPIPTTLIDGADVSAFGGIFPAQKGPLVTQELRGLANHLVNPESQALYANQPFHWRGDRATLATFNSTFVTLLRGSPLGTTDMTALTDFLHTCTFPPNPEQPLDRIVPGTAGTPGLEDGSGALRGQKLFHTRGPVGGVMGGRSCIQCHSGVTGSNNRITASSDQPLQTAPLRFPFAREARLETSPISLSRIVTGQFGLTHTGLLATSLNDFMLNFATLFPGTEIVKLIDLMTFTRQFDTGIAPLVGRTWTFTTANRNQPGTPTAFALFEGQVLAGNAGLAVHARIGKVLTGYWFDVTASPPAYRREGSSTLVSRTQLLTSMQNWDDSLIVQATPLGSDRRIASVTGVATVLTGSAPSQITLEAMSTSSHWTQVPTLTKNWNKGTTANDFVWSGPAAEPRFLKTIRIYQHALITLAPSFGITVKRHEAPRRLRVAGTNIRAGSKLILQFTKTATKKPPFTVDPQYVQRLEVPIFPTTQFTTDNRRIWETAAELDPIHCYALMLGGYAAPGVQAAYDGSVVEPPPSGTFDPSWNLFFTSVENEDGTRGDATTWQVLKIR